MKQNNTHKPADCHQSATADNHVARARRPLAGFTFALVAVAALALGNGCGGDKKSATQGGHSHASHHSAASQSAPANARIVAEDGKITIESGDNMRYDTTAFVVQPGQSVELTLRHTGRMHISAMGHNVVILKKYTDVRAFSQAAARSAATDYIPNAMASQVLAHTKMLGGGESDTITFTAPTAPGEYDFICSFPAHLIAGMQGKMIVRKD